MEIAGRTFRGLGLLLSLVRSYAQSTEAGLKIDVHLYNYSGVSEEELARAEQETVRIYRSLGVEMEWRNCPRTAEELAQNTLCELPAAPTRFTLRLLSDEMAQRFPVGDDVYGFALPVRSGFGVLANVFADRARETRDGELRKVILGHVIAHELGHLLLGEAGHPACGIMHVPWQTKELDLIKQGGMSFLPKQAKRIRAQVLARIMAAPPHTSLDTPSSVTTGPSAVCSVASNARAKDSGRQTYNVSAHMSTKVDVSPTLIEGSQRAATVIIANIGVQLRWTGQSSQTSRNLPTFTGPPAMPDIVVEIVAHAPDNAGDASLAMAMPYADSGVRVVIFYDRVTPLLRDHHASAVTILGYVLVHEIAHVLQGVARHSEHGVMRARWTDLDYRWMSIGMLNFTAEDVQLIRRHLRQIDSVHQGRLQ